MFCPKCGSQLPDGSTFCSTCGQPLGAAPAQAPNQAPVPGGFGGAPAAPSATAQFFNKVWGYVKSFFTKDPAVTLNNAAHERSALWGILTVVLWVVGFCTMLTVVQAVGHYIHFEDESWNSILREYHKADKDYPGSVLEMYGFWKVFGFSLLVILPSFLVKIVGTWIAAAKVSKINVSLTNVANAAAVAELPVIASMILAIIFAFIWLPLAIVFLGIGAVASKVMLYEVVKTSGMCPTKTAWSMTVVYAVAGIVFWLFLFLFLKVAGCDEVENAFASTLVNWASMLVD